MKVKAIAAMLKAMHAQEDLPAAHDKGRQTKAKPRTLRFARAGKIVTEHAHETLTYYCFPSEHWRRIRTNSPPITSVRRRLASRTGHRVVKGARFAQRRKNVNS